MLATLLFAVVQVVVLPPHSLSPTACPAACGQCPPAGSSGACCHGNRSCETGSWTVDSCTPAMGTWCTHNGPWPPPPPLPPCPPHARRPPSPPPPAGGKPRQKVYVVLRLDDISVGEALPRFSGGEVINWALKNQVKINLGIMAGGPEQGGSPLRTWPTDCGNRRAMDGRPGTSEADADDPLCSDEVVSALNSAYGNGNLVGQPNPLIEIFDHSYLHYEWANLWPLSASYQFDDMRKSADLLRQA